MLSSCVVWISCLELLLTNSSAGQHWQSDVGFLCNTVASLQETFVTRNGAKVCDHPPGEIRNLFLTDGTLTAGERKTEKSGKCFVAVEFIMDYRLHFSLPKEKCRIVVFVSKLSFMCVHEMVSCYSSVFHLQLLVPLYPPCRKRSLRLIQHMQTSQKITHTYSWWVRTHVNTRNNNRYTSKRFDMDISVSEWNTIACHRLSRVSGLERGSVG